MVIAAIGGMCLPIGIGVSHRRDLSVFYNIRDLGGFVQMGLALLAVGLIAFAMSFAVKGDLTD
jgi:hypothetical protein